jgi:hypothetical protein
MTQMMQQQTPFLRLQRSFPSDDIQALTVELDKSYIDIAQRVNDRTIGIFAFNRPSATGEAWYQAGSNAKQQTLRQLYAFTAAGNIPHGIPITGSVGFQGITRLYGTFTDGTNWYPLPYVDVVAANNQVNVYVTPTNIVITSGGGAPPTIVSGWVILEWLAAV